jgi:hypothetical protein
MLDTIQLLMSIDWPRLALLASSCVVALSDLATFTKLDHLFCLLTSTFWAEPSLYILPPNLPSSGFSIPQLRQQ